MDNFRKKSALRVAKRNATKTPLIKIKKFRSFKRTEKSSAYFNIQTESSEQDAQNITKWCCLTNEAAAQYETKRTCEAEINVKNVQPEQRDQHQRRYSQGLLALLAPNSL